MDAATVQNFVEFDAGATKALRYAIHSQPFAHAPYSNSLAVLKALDARAALWAHAGLRATCTAELGAAGGKQYDNLVAQRLVPERVAFDNKIKAFKLPEDMDMEWRELEHPWTAWIGACQKSVEDGSRLAASLVAATPPEAQAPLFAQLKASADKIADDYAKSLIKQVDARQAKKAAKALEKEKARLEAEEGNAPARKASKKAAKKEGEGEVAAPAAGEPISEALAKLLVTGEASSKKKDKGAKAPGKAPSGPKDKPKAVVAPTGGA